MADTKINIVLICSNQHLCKLWTKYFNEYLAYCSTAGKTSAPNNNLSANVSIQTKYLQDLEFSKIGLFQRKASSNAIGVSCFVSPANSFGYMNGGYDLHLARLFSPVLYTQRKTNDSKASYLSDMVSNYKLTEAFVKDKLLRARNGYLPGTSSCLVDFLESHNHQKTIKQKSSNPFEDFKSKSTAWQKFRGRYLLVAPTMKTPHKLQFLSKQDSYNYVFDLCWEVFSTVESHNNQVRKLNGKHDDTENILNIVLPALGTGYGGIDMEIVAKAMIYSIVIYYNAHLTSLEKSFYVMKFLQERQLDGLLVHGIEKDTGEVVGPLEDCNFENYSFEKHEASKENLLKNRAFDIDNDGFHKFFGQ